MAQIVKMIDPPSGCLDSQKQYQMTDVNKWLVENGYPQKMIDDLGEYFFVREWIQ